MSVSRYNVHPAVARARGHLAAASKRPNNPALPGLRRDFAVARVEEALDAALLATPEPFTAEQVELLTAKVRQGGESQ